MNYEEMNNHQINKRVARAIGVEWIAVAKDGLIVDGKSASVDYCNNPSDAWPIIVENRIGVTPYQTVKCLWSATRKTDSTTMHVTMQNPLRAAMICFLKMKDAEK